MTNTSIAGSGHHAGGTQTNPVLRGIAHVISYLFHPLFISCYVMAFLIFVHPYAFAGFDERTKVFRFLNVVFCDTFLPLFAVFLMWRLKLIHSVFLRSEKDRIIPYIVAMTFYWWTWMVFKNLPDIPVLAIRFLLGAFLAICGGWICNIFFKISMHAIAMGGALMFFMLFDLDVPHQETVLEAFDKFEDRCHVLVSGVGVYDKFDGLTKFQSIEQVTILDSLDVGVRLNEIAELRDGWFNGEGTGPDVNALRWFADTFDNNYEVELPLPLLYPTLEGGIHAEWSSIRISISLKIDLQKKSGYFHSLDLATGIDTEHEISLGDNTGWKFLNTTLNTLLKG